MAHLLCIFAAELKTVIMTGYFEIYYDLPHLEAFLKAGGTQYNSQSLKNEIDDFLREAVLYHIEEKKFVIRGMLTDYLENEELFEGSRDIFRRMPTISSDIFFDTDLWDLIECSHHLAEKLLDWKKSGKHSEQKLFRTTADVLFAKKKESENQADNKSRPLVFLDFDGVLNTERHFAELKGKGLPFKDKYGPKFDLIAVENLKKIIDTTEARIVVSSSWRYMGLGDLQRMWNDRDLPGKIVGITPLHMDDDKLLETDLSELDEITADMFCSSRGNEIKAYFEEVLRVVADTRRYVILDDLKDVLPEQEDHFIRINPIVGITEKDAERAIEILNC
jgi:hypothetical protein